LNDQSKETPQEKPRAESPEEPKEKTPPAAPQPEKKLSPEELQTHDGQEDRPAYIAYQGKIYDVSGSKLWRKGQHMRKHQAGHDLTAEIAAAPHGTSVLERMPRVGVLADFPEKQPGEVRVRLLDRFFDLHPHPVSVHFPIAYVAGTAILLILYFLTHNALFETVAYYVLWMGTIFTPVAIALGTLSWWINYNHVLTLYFKLKISLSLLLFLLGAGALWLRTANPTLLIYREPLTWLYIGLVGAMVILVSALGWIGARILFPKRK